jgi:predicted DNA-binding antitoxin AbrB/MazE fold protein
MLKFKARYKNGIIEPLEKIEIKEGSEITIALLEQNEVDPKGLIRSFGGWKNTVDCDELIKNIYADRQISTRPEVKL